MDLPFCLSRHVNTVLWSLLRYSKVYTTMPGCCTISQPWWWVCLVYSGITCSQRKHCVKRFLSSVANFVFYTVSSAIPHNTHIHGNALSSCHGYGGCTNTKIDTHFGPYWEVIKMFVSWTCSCWIKNGLLGEIPSLFTSFMMVILWIDCHILLYLRFFIFCVARSSWRFLLLSSWICFLSLKYFFPQDGIRVHYPI